MEMVAAISCTGMIKKAVRELMDIDIEDCWKLAIL